MRELAQPLVYQVRVFLRGISPMIWRRVLIRSDSTIADLHYTLQIVVGWTDVHLHRFHIHGKDYGIAQVGGPSFPDDPDTVRLADFGFRTREWFVYEYNVTDSWQHEVRVEQILALDPQRHYPVCIGGKRAAPPEGCGGPRLFLERVMELPGECDELLEQIEEAVVTGDMEWVCDQRERLASLRPWLALDRFARLRANRRLQQYIQRERQWLFADDL